MLEGGESPNGEWRETFEELSELLFVVQEIGRRLANETHGESYDLVRGLNECMHQVRVKMEGIRQTLKDE